MTKYEQLKKTAQDRGWGVGTFVTHATNYYENAVLCVYVGEGKPHNRQSHRVIRTWDVSYSVGRRETGNNKWARALEAAEQYITQQQPPDVAALDANEDARRQAAQRHGQARRAAKRRAERQQTAAQVATLRPTTLAEQSSRIPAAVLASFGLDEAEHQSLLHDPDIVALAPDGSLLVKQVTLRHGLGWYHVNADTYATPVIAL